MWGKNPGKDKSSKMLPVPQCCRVAVACKGQHLQPSPQWRKHQQPPAEQPRKDDVQGGADEGRSRVCQPLESKVKDGVEQAC